MATLNVRTLSDTINNTGKAEMLVDTLTSHRITACGISELRWQGSGEKIISGNLGGPWHFLYSGTAQRREQGVAIAMSPTARKALDSYKPINSRLITATFKTPTVPLTIIQTYAPTNSASSTVKHTFYTQLQQTLHDIPSSHYLILMGDFNAKVGRHADQWEGCIGRFGLPSPVCDNGQRLLDLCTANSLAITDTMFQHKRIHLATWRSNDGITKNQIDHILVRQRDAVTAHDCRAYRGADVGSDHYLLICKLKLKLKRTRRTPRHPRFQTASLRTEQGKAAFQDAVAHALNTPSTVPNQSKLQHLTQALTLAGQQQLPPAPSARRPWISPATLQLA